MLFSGNHPKRSTTFTYEQNKLHFQLMMTCCKNVQDVPSKSLHLIASNILGSTLVFALKHSEADSSKANYVSLRWCTVNLLTHSQERVLKVLLENVTIRRKASLSSSEMRVDDVAQILMRSEAPMMDSFHQRFKSKQRTPCRAVILS